jgi:hypothetical protein
MLSQMENEASYMKNEVGSMMPSMTSSQTPGMLSQMENEASYMKNEVGSMMPSMTSSQTPLPSQTSVPSQTPGFFKRMENDISSMLDLRRKSSTKMDVAKDVEHKAADPNGRYACKPSSILTKGFGSGSVNESFCLL